MYLGGQVAYFDDCNSYYMSLILMKDMAKDLGYSGNTVFYYKIFGLKLTKRLVYIAIDEICYQMRFNMPKDKIADVYVKKVY